MTGDRVRVARDGDLATVTLTGPGGVNTMSRSFFDELPDVVADLEQDDDVRAVVFTGDGGHFSYGLDLADLAPVLAGMQGAVGARERLGFRDFVLAGQQSMRAVAACTKPTVAAVDGWCIGGGLALASACDVRVATAGARFAMREVRLAVVADMGSLQWLAGIVGDGHLRQLALSGAPLAADRAERIGLLNEVVADSAALLPAARGLAATFTANSPLVLRGIKDVLEAERRARVDAGLRGVAEWNAAYLPEHDLGEAVRAFAEGREPVFAGR